MDWWWVASCRNRGPRDLWFPKRKTPRPRLMRLRRRLDEKPTSERPTRWLARNAGSFSTKLAHVRFWLEMSLFGKSRGNSAVRVRGNNSLDMFFLIPIFYILSFMLLLSLVILLVRILVRSIYMCFCS